MNINYSSRLQFFLGLLGFVILAGTLGFHQLNNIDLIDAFYFSIVTITTVGYGDIHPITDSGKMLAIFVIIAGGISFLGVVANTTELLLSQREKRLRKQKLNIVSGVFFSELGNELLHYITRHDANRSRLMKFTHITPHWDDKDFQRARRLFRKYHFTIQIPRHRFIEVKSILCKNPNLLIQLLLNPTIIEHEEFTDLLQSVSHLKEECLYRKDLNQIIDLDEKHLCIDLSRVYQHLSLQWLTYVEHLKECYPFLFSLAVRNNPFLDSDAEITE